MGKTGPVWPLSETQAGLLPQRRRDAKGAEASWERFEKSMPCFQTAGDPIVLCAPQRLCVSAVNFVPRTSPCNPSIRVIRDSDRFRASASSATGSSCNVCSSYRRSHHDGSNCMTICIQADALRQREYWFPGIPLTLLLFNSAAVLSRILRSPQAYRTIRAQDRRFQKG